jgi:hypothetical protein
MKYYICIFAFLFHFSQTEAQMNDATWILISSLDPNVEIFNGNSILNFYDDSLNIHWEDRNINASGSWGLISDEEGQLQFYTNSCSVFSYDDNLMENGDSLNYPQPLWDFYCEDGYPEFGNTLIIPFPNTANCYLLFYLKRMNVFSSPEFLYAKINMNLNEGKGKVELKNFLLMQGNFEKSSGVKHSNGRDWWVLVPGNTDSKYYRLLATPSGITGPHEQTIVGVSQDSIYISGTKLFSPDGTKYVDCNSNNGINIFDFDRCSGLLSNFQYIPNAVGAAFHNLAISPNSRYLYLSLTNTGKLIQYDLTSDDIASTGDTVGVYDGFYDSLANHATVFSFMQLAPDGKIYMPTQSRFMHVIQDPNQQGSLCNFEQRAIELPSAVAYPITPHFPNYRLGPVDGSPCDTLGINNIPVAKFRCKADPDDPLNIIFTDLSYYEPTQWSWDFDDSSGGSTEVNPLHAYEDYGIYDVCLTVSNPYGSDTWCKQISIIPTATGDLPQQDGFLLYPNPASEELHLVYTLSHSGDFRVILYNALGQKVMEMPLPQQSGDIVIPFKAMPSGLYYGVVDDRRRVVFRGKVVKK